MDTQQVVGPRKGPTIEDLRAMFSDSKPKQQTMDKHVGINSPIVEDILTRLREEQKGIGIEERLKRLGFNLDFVRGR